MPEFTKEQLARIDEIHNAVFEMCKVLTQRTDLQWDMAFIGEIADVSADILTRQGFSIVYPAIATDSNGHEFIIDCYPFPIQEDEEETPEDNKIKALCLSAGRWWAKKVDGYGNHDNGATDPQNALAMMLADMLNKPVDHISLEHFAQVLAQNLLDEKKKGRNRIHLMCDYSPCQALAEAADACGIPSVNFPFKTGMIIDFDNGTISVSDGYGQPWSEIRP